MRSSPGKLHEGEEPAEPGFMAEYTPEHPLWVLPFLGELLKDLSWGRRRLEERSIVVIAEMPRARCR